MRWPQPSKKDARKAIPLNMVNSRDETSLPTVKRAVFASHLTPYRAISLPLPAQRHANGPDVATAVKRSQTDRMFARRERRQLNRISFVPAISNPVVRE